MLMNINKTLINVIKMLIPLQTLIDKYNIRFNGILHVGAHECEEIHEYEKHLIRDKILWIEAMTDKVQLCKMKYPDIHIENAVVSDIEETVTFKISNNGMSSSMLELGLHRSYHPDVFYTHNFKCNTTLLKNILKQYPDIQFNFLNLDIQGAELKAIKGMGEYLNNVDYIYTEVNSDYVYKGCALISELDSYLSQFNFIRVETQMTDWKWGDAFYIRSKNHTTTFGYEGRFGNKFFRNMSIHFIAKNNNLKVTYDSDYSFKRLGIELFSGANEYLKNTTLSDQNFYQYVNDELKINANIKLEGYMQTKEFSRFLFKYFQNEEIQMKIKKSNPYASRYGNNNDVFIHVRLGDALCHNPGFDYYDNVMSKIHFNDGYISSDTIQHNICKRLIQKYNLKIINTDEVDTIQFSSTCTHLILSNGTFSWTIGVLGFFSNVYYPKISTIWHGDIFSIDSWNEVKININETDCNYVSSRGIMKICDIYSSTPISSIKQLVNYDFSKLKEGTSIYICGSALPHFVNVVAPQIKVNYRLVTGDCDETIPMDVFPGPNEFQAFLNSPYLIHWYSQNCAIKNCPKMTQMPIGMDYHTMSQNNHEWGPKTSPVEQEQQIKTIAENSKPICERKMMAYANFQFLMTTRYAQDRYQAIAQIPQELVYYEPLKTSRLNTWKTQSEYAFVISPHGNGYDCHRTWEALILGCIPIVKTSFLDELFDNLPVLIVKEWSDINIQLLENTVKMFQNKTFNLEKLTLKYWESVIKGQKDVN